MTEEMLLSKNQWGLVAACIGLFMCLFFAVSVSLLKRLDVIGESQMDLELVTIDDYTAQTRLDPEIYREFKAFKVFYSNDVPIMEFKQEIHN